MGPKTINRTRIRKIYAWLAVSALGTMLCAATSQTVIANSQTLVRRKPVSSGPLVIQGRITTIEGALVSVKTPDGSPGGPGIHAQVVIAGPAFKVDVSHARVLLPDGRRPDTLPLAVGDRVLMVLTESDSKSSVLSIPGSVPGTNNKTYFASTIERVEIGDKMTTH